MNVDKVILRTVLTTLAAILTLFVFMFTALTLVFPSTMMEITYDLGMEGASIRFAERAYKNSDLVDYIAYATEVAIETDKDGKIVSCGEKLIADEHFERYCADKESSEGYRQGIYSQICMAKYELGEGDAAIELASSSIAEGRFPVGNALVALTMTAKVKGDSQTLEKLREKLIVLSVSEEGEKAYLAQTLAVIEG